MAIIINDYEPSGDFEEVQFPGSKKRYKIPTSDILTVGDIIDLSNGDNNILLRIFPEETHEALRKLHKTQLEEFITAWTGSPKD